jgi:hypothetical protein
MRMIAVKPTYDPALRRTKIEVFGEPHKDWVFEVYERGSVGVGASDLSERSSHGCCATHYISGFYGDMETVREVLNKTVNDQYDYSIVLTDEQDRLYGKVLKELKFEKIRRWHNRTHGPSILNLYLRGFQDDEPLPLEK